MSGKARCGIYRHAAIIASLSTMVLVALLPRPVLATSASLAQIDVQALIQEEIEDELDARLERRFGQQRVDPYRARELDRELELGSEDPVTVIVHLINIALSFLAIIFVVTLLWAGLQYMTAGGNEERQTKARKTFANALIGVILILMAFSVSQFVLGSLQAALGNTDTVNQF